MGDDWCVFEYRALPMDSFETQVYELTGAVAPLKTKGPGKGVARAWARRDLSTQRTVYFTPDEYRAWNAARTEDA